MARGKALAAKMRQELRRIRIEELPTNQEKVEHIIGYGILAPSTHNTQPWKLKIGDNQLEVYADFEKGIPQADPMGRDMYMSLGALIKNVELAAEAFDVEISIVFSSSLKNRPPVAAITFQNLDNAQDPEKSDVLDALIERQNYRGFFKPEIDQEVVRGAIDSIKIKEVAVQAFFDTKTIHDFANLTAEGLKMAYATPSFREEISSFINHNLSRKRYGLHGYSLRMSSIQSFIIPRVMKRKDVGPKLAELNYKSFVSAPGVIVLAAEDNELSWLKAGMVLEEIMVRLAMHGITSSIYAAAIEMGDLRSRLTEMVELPQHSVPQLLFCVGEPTLPLPYSVRKNLSTVVVK